MRNRASAILILLMLVLILYALAQNGALGNIGSIFNTTPNGTVLFGGITARPIFPTQGSRPIFSTLPPNYTPPPTLIFGAPNDPNTGSTDPNGVYAGQSGCIVPNGWVPYTIQNGDTIGTIATAYGIDVNQFIAANCLVNPDLVYVGQIIYVPAR